MFPGGRCAGLWIREEGYSPRGDDAHCMHVLVFIFVLRSFFVLYEIGLSGSVVLWISRGEVVAPAGDLTFRGSVVLVFGKGLGCSARILVMN